MRRFLLPLLALLVALCGGCATDQRNQTLITTLNAYAGTLRWGDFQTALQFVDPKVRAAHPPSALDLARFQQVRVTGYDDGAGPVPDGENQVRQLVQISLVNVNTQAERTVLDRQTWRYEADKKRWWLMSGLPDITND